ncbi:hypothetical protein INT45_012524 [Circinella minor]|uniref:AN1-type domain-containing protein n=1 Tax=Circinella minor TaxID=1195481 RepID=A0A8H7S481_9FUNG|nr:hypothetical protein INT45_012524 [Circinella minor]
MPTTDINPSKENPRSKNDKSHQQVEPNNTRSQNKIKNRCTYNNCTGRVVKIIGECRYCDSKYCGRHRLPESHSCNNITSCRQDAYEKNTSKLLRERCVASKV